jgi:DNA-binding MarR family transcriptional regulator
MIDLQELGLAVKQAQWRHHRAMDRRLAAIGTTLVQWDSLRAIARRPGASAHDLAQATFQSDQAFGTLANRLAAQGLIERSPGEGRRIRHHLTPAGSEMLAVGTDVAESFLAESFAPLDDAEREVLLDLLNRLGG